MAAIRKRGDAYQIRVSCGYDINGNHKEQSESVPIDLKKLKKYDIIKIL